MQTTRMEMENLQNERQAAKNEIVRLNFEIRALTEENAKLKKDKSSLLRQLL